MAKARRKTETNGARVATGPYTAYMTLKDVANFLAVHRSTVRKMVKAGQLPYKKVRGRYRFDVLAVRSAIDKHS